MNKELYVSTTPHETKVALVEDDQLAEIYFERENEYTLAGSIYKGRVTRVLPGMQSAFVDIGLERDAFLYVSDFLDLQDDEDEEFTDVKVTGQTLAQANGFVLQEQASEETEEFADDEADETETSPEEAKSGAPAQSDDSNARRWRGRRRRRGRRGGRERYNNAPNEETVESVSAEVTSGEGAEGEDSFAEAAKPESYVDEAEYEDEAETPAAAAGKAEAPEEPSTPAAPTERILLPGESIKSYSRPAGERESAEAEEETPSEYRRDAHRDRGERRGFRGRGRDRGDRDRGRESRRPREEREPEAPLPANYQPIVLPGESLSKYRGIEPISVGDVGALSEQAESGKKTSPEFEGELVSQKDLQETVLGEAAVAAPTIVPFARTNRPFEEEHAAEEPAAVEPELDAKATVERLESLNVANILSGEEVEKNGTEDEITEARATHAQVELTPETDEVPEQPSKAVLGEHEEVPTHEAGSYTIEGGFVEHEEIDEEEADMPSYSEHFNQYHMHDLEEETLDSGSRIDAAAGMLGDVVRDTDEERELERDEYEFNGDSDEFEESEMVAGEEIEEVSEDEIGENGRAEHRAPAPTAGFQQRTDRGERFERRGRRDRGDRDRDRRGGGGGPRGRMRRREPRIIPQISDVLKEGQEILVQIAKEPIGKKGARITSHIALPGRFLVYMPTVNHIGVSRKINSEEERQRLKRIVASERENGHGGFIVRTAAAHIKEDELRADIRFLKHLWHEIRTRAEGSKSPALIYHDLNLVERVLRDQVTSDFSQIWVDNESEYERIVRFASRFQPSLVRRIKLYSKDVPLYEQFGIQEEINKGLKSKVWLKSGGYIVINQTEALVAIDINTGKYVGKTARLEDTIVKTNCDAIKEIVRQIRLRDLGGIIVIDFIDMDERKNRQKVMQTLEEALKADRAPSKVLQFNDFGLVAITRKRVKQSLERTLGSPCPYCSATGFVKSVSTVANEIYVEMRKIRRHIESKDVVLRVNPEVAKELKSSNGRWLGEMEELIGHTILLKSDASLHQEQFDINF